MLNENYFTDTFILHDQTLHPDFIDNFNKIVMKENKEAQTIDHNFVAHHVDPASDYINELIKHWASFKCLFKFQPMSLIREYFGEKIALYFAWTGMLIATLILPSIIGVIFFGVGLNLRCFNSYFLKLN